MSAICHIESILPQRIFTGWAQVQGRSTPVTVIINLGGKAVAKARACTFRSDLLVAGVGHGHYGFKVPAMAPIPPGEHIFELIDADTHQHFHNSPIRAVVPRSIAGTSDGVDWLWAPADTWTDADVRTSVECLQLQRNFERLGPRRFFEVICRFLLDRWPTTTELESVVSALASETVSPHDYFVKLLDRTANPEGPRRLPSPFDPHLVGQFIFSES